MGSRSTGTRGHTVWTIHEKVSAHSVTVGFQTYISIPIKALICDNVIVRTLANISKYTISLIFI